jgi:hypothetical protein
MYINNTVSSRTKAMSRRKEGRREGTGVLETMRRERRRETERDGERRRETEREMMGGRQRHRDTEQTGAHPPKC